MKNLGRTKKMVCFAIALFTSHIFAADCVSGDASITFCDQNSAKTYQYQTPGYFVDIKDNEFENNVMLLSANCIIQKSNYFYGDRPITRAESLKIIINALTDQNSNWKKSNFSNVPMFSDVQVTDWYYDYVLIALSNEIISHQSTVFRPNDPISRQEFAKLIDTALIKLNSGDYNETPTNYAQDNPFFDGGDISSEFIPSVYRLKYNTILGGYQDKTFRPNNNITRYEVAKIVAKSFFRQFSDMCLAISTKNTDSCSSEPTKYTVYGLGHGNDTSEYVRLNRLFVDKLNGLNAASSGRIKWDVLDEDNLRSVTSFARKYLPDNHPRKTNIDKMSELLVKNIAKLGNQTNNLLDEQATVSAYFKAAEFSDTLTFGKDLFLNATEAAQLTFTAATGVDIPIKISPSADIRNISQRIKGYDLGELRDLGDCIQSLTDEQPKAAQIILVCSKMVNAFFKQRTSEEHETFLKLVDKLINFGIFIEEATREGDKDIARLKAIQFVMETIADTLDMANTIDVSPGLERFVAAIKIPSVALKTRISALEYQKKANAGLDAEINAIIQAHDQQMRELLTVYRISVLNLIQDYHFTIVKN